MSNESGNGKYAPRPGNIPGVAVNLGGIDLVLAPLGLRLVRELQTKTNELKAKAANGTDAAETDAAFYAVNVDSVYASLLRNYPEITRDEVEALLDAGNLTDCVSAIMGMSGLKKVTPGEIPPRG